MHEAARPLHIRLSLHRVVSSRITKATQHRLHCLLLDGDEGVGALLGPLQQSELVVSEVSLAHEALQRGRLPARRGDLPVATTKSQ